MGRELRGLGAVILAALLTLGGTLLAPRSAQALPQYSYDCKFCHQMPPKDSGTTKKDPFTGGVPGNHAGHATQDPSSCAPCHGDVSSYGPAHRNKIIEMTDTVHYTRKQPGVFMNQTTVPPNPLGYCSNVACHSDGGTGFKPTPFWGANPADTNCSTCHDAAPNTGKHYLKHAAYYGTGPDGCAKCHSDHSAEQNKFSHATSGGRRPIDVRFTAAPNNGGDPYQSGTCSNIYCHSDGRGGYKTVTWNVGTTLDCTGCHGNATSTGPAALSGKHASHVNNPRLGTNYGCIDCHAGTVSDNSTIADTSKHVLGLGKANLFGTNLGNVSSGTCNNSYCHSDGKGGNKSVTWTQTETVGCNGCHGTSNAYGAPDYTSEAPGTLKANNHDKHAKSSADCVNCHSKTTVTGTSIIPGSQHTDGFANYTAGNGYTFVRGANKTCSNISCHSGNNTVKNVAAAQWGAHFDCSGCHSALSATHSAHTGEYGCVSCHSSTVSDNTTISNPAYHMNNVPDVAGSTYTRFTLSDHTCATSCHMTVSPKWNDPSTGACGTCHDVFSPYGQLITTGAHAMHFTADRGPKFPQTEAGCQACHVYNGERQAPHADTVKNMLPGYNASGGCSTCHRQSSTEWTISGSVTCDSCHSSASGLLSVYNGVIAPDERYAGSAGHGRSGIGKVCADCHDTNSPHLNGRLGDKRLITVLQGSGTDNTECDYCHQDAGKVGVDKVGYKAHMDSGAGSMCADCHNPHGNETNTMMVRESINGTQVTFTGNNTFANEARTGVCQVCHNSTRFFSQAGQPQEAHQDTTANCLDCHPHNPTSGLAFTANGACNSCHGYPPAPRRTITENVFGIMGNWSTAKFEDYSGGGGAHTVPGHIRKDIRLTGTTDDWTPCLPCHHDAAGKHLRTYPVGTHVPNVTVTLDPQYRFSPDYYMIYSSAQLTNGGTNKTGTCFNVSCHMGPSPKWSIER